MLPVRYRAHCTRGLSRKAVLQCSTRPYTPIFTPDPATDHVAPLRAEDEVRTLWQSHPVIPSVAAGVTWWLRFGNDPVVHTALDPLRNRRDTYDDAALPHSTSPFAFVEDMLGTNLITGDAEQVKESAELWSTYFTHKYLGQMRQSRRTAANHVGRANGGGDGSVFLDEADQPNTTWLQDTAFQELAFLSERHLKVRVGSMAQLEEALWYSAGVDELVAFFDALQQQTALRVPLPVASIWVYDGDARRGWAREYVPAAHAARTFFDTILAPDLRKLGSESELLRRVAAAMDAVHAIELRRAERQVAAGLRPSWDDASTAPAAAREAWAMNELERTQRSVEEGVYDPEDMLDDTEAWGVEHAAMEAVLHAPVEGCGFSLHDFWLHTIRREELETRHVLEDDHLRRVAAAARVALYDEVALSDVYAARAESVRRGQLDVRAAVLRPQLNPIWCKLHYAKFGGGAVVQHTHTATRQLLFHHAASTQALAATAQLYFASKPLSTSLDYSSPYTLRRSLAALCARYGVDMTHAIQRPVLLSAAHLARAETAIAAVVRHTAHAMGRRRRRHARRSGAEDEVVINSVRVLEPHSELLETGEALRPRSDDDDDDVATLWPLGSRKTVAYTTASTLDARHRLELSLWRRCGVEERQARRRQRDAVDAAVEFSLRTTPTLVEVQLYARRLYTHLAANAVPEHISLNDDETDAEWVFACMLDDQVRPSERGRAEVYLPYYDADGALLPTGEYRVRVRVYDAEQCQGEATSSPFPIFDALPQLLEQFCADHPKSNATQFIHAEDWVAWGEFLRDGGLDVPLHCEFEAGQTLDVHGNVLLEPFLALLRGNTHHRAQSERGITDVQRRIEPDCRAHWELYHPGASAEEWACCRRAVLTHAMAQERDWWLPDPLLYVDDCFVTASARHTALDLSLYPAAVRYAGTLCAVLTAEGHSHGHVPKCEAATTDGAPQASCVVDGTGALTRLTFDVATSSTTSVAAALQTAQRAIERAQSRHCTLSMYKTGPFAKQAQVSLFCNVDGLEFGGKYARTYCYAVRKAKEQLAQTELSGRAVPGVGDKDQERRSEQSTEVDRFASDSHPEQRKKLFVPRTTPSGMPIEDPTPDQTSTWGR